MEPRPTVEQLLSRIETGLLSNSQFSSEISLRMNRPILHRAHYVLHPTDFSIASEVAFAHALRIALFDEARLTVLHAEKERKHGHWSDYPSVRNTLEQWKLIEPGTRRHELHRKAGISVEKVMAEGSNAANAILEYTEANSVDLIVLATHGRDGLPRWLHPSVAEPVARKSRIPTLFVPHGCRGFVAPEDGTVSLRRVLVPIDQQPRPQRGVDAAIEALQAFGDNDSELTLLHVGKESDSPSVTLPPEVPWKIHRRTRQGSPISEILSEAEAQQSDLIVAVTEGHHGILDALRGSTTEQMVRSNLCPVLAVPRSKSKS